MAPVQGTIETTMNEKHQHFVFFANWSKRAVRDHHNKPVGVLWDLVINPQEPYPPVTAVILSRGTFKREYAVLPWSDVADIDTCVRLRVEASTLLFQNSLNLNEFRIRKDILDQQVVDTHNHKVIRVNDVHLLTVTPPRVVHVDIGTRGLVRRMHWEGWVDRLVRFFKPRAHYLKDDRLISWKFVKTISSDLLQPIQMDLSAKQLSNIPPADLGEIMMDLDINQRIALLRLAEPHQRARLFERLDFSQQEQLMEHLSQKEIVDLVSRMSADEAVDLLGQMTGENSRQLLGMMESNKARRLSQLLGYEQDEAGGIMTTEFLDVHTDKSVREALDLVKEKTPHLETIYYLYVTDDQKKLIGTTTLRQLISADPAIPVVKTIFPKPVFVYLNTSMKEVAFLMDKYKVSALPVVDKEKHLQGIITVDDVLHHVIPIAWRRRAGKKHA